MLDDRRDAPTDNAALTAARGLRPLVEAEAAAAEQACTLTPLVVDALWDSGLMTMANPAEAGGDSPWVNDLMEVWEELAHQDGSVGWIGIANFTAASFLAAYLPEEGFAEVFGGQRHRTTSGGQFAPNGRGEAVDGGYRVTGDFRFGSGTDHSDWVVGGFVPHDDGSPRFADNGLPEMLVAVVPRTEVEFHDNWDVTGLRATGSYDYRVDDVLVPQYRTFPLFTRRPRRGGPVFGLGILPITGAGHGAWALGVSRSALDDLVVLGSKKIRMGEGDTILQKPTVQRGLAHHTAMWRAARAHLHDEHRRVRLAITADADLTPRMRADLRMASTYATECAREIVQWCHLAAGTTAIRTGSRLERAFRDMYTGTQHAFVSERTYIDSAQVTLGLVPDHPAV